MDPTAQTPEPPGSRRERVRADHQIEVHEPLWDAGGVVLIGNAVKTPRLERGQRMYLRFPRHRYTEGDDYYSFIVHVAYDDASLSN